MVASFADVLPSALRRLALRHTTFQTATCATIRLQLLKIGTRATVSVRRITVSMTHAFYWTYKLLLASPGLKIGSDREDATAEHTPG